MRVTVSGRHMSVSESLKRYCLEKAQKLERFFDRIQAVDVVLDGQAGIHTAEMIVHADGNPPFVARESQEDVYAAIDILIDKIERQLTRHKEKLRNRKHPPRSASGETEG